MDASTHMLAVVDSMDDRESTLELARDVVAGGGSATVLARLGSSDREHIRAYADSEELTLATAEARYVDATVELLRDAVGRDSTVAYLADVDDGRRVIDAAVREHAAVVAIPSSLAGRRGWRRAIAATPVQVVVAPTRAA